MKTDLVKALDIIRLQHREWETSNFGNQPMRLAATGCVEECGELAHCMLKFEQGIRDMTLEKFIKEGRDALADIGIYAISVANKIEHYAFEGNLLPYMLETFPRQDEIPDTKEGYMERIPVVILTYVRVVKFSNKLLYTSIMKDKGEAPALLKALMQELNVMANYMFHTGILDLIQETWDAQVRKREWKEANKVA